MEDDIQQKISSAKYNFFKKDDPNRLIYDSQSQLLTRNTSAADESTDFTATLPTQSAFFSIPTASGFRMVKSMSEPQLSRLDTNYQHAKLDVRAINLSTNPTIMYRNRLRRNNTLEGNFLKIPPT